MAQAAAYHPPRPVGHLRVRARRRSRANGRYRLVPVLRRLDPATLDGKSAAAFRAGFLGVDELGFSTLVEVAEVTAPTTGSARSKALARS